jgi:MFS family permease
MMEILRSGPFWRAVPLLGLTAGIHIAILTLWSGPWLRDVMGLPPHDAARQLLWMAVAFIVGILGTGFIADRLGRRGVEPMTVLLACQLVYFAGQAVLVAQWRPGAMAAWWVVAALGQTATLGFPWLQRFYPVSVAGRCNATLNFAMFAVAFCAQYAVGLVIDLYPATATGYAPDGYRMAMGIGLALQVLAFLWYVFAPLGREPARA